MKMFKCIIITEARELYIAENLTKEEVFALVQHDHIVICDNDGIKEMSPEGEWEKLEKYPTEWMEEYLEASNETD